ncbi:caspase family protein [Streptomyces sp. NPDC001984]
MARTTRGALTRPELPAGSRKTLNDALHDLHRQAGWPSMRELAADVKAARLMSVPPSHSRIHDAFTKPRLPQCELLAAVVCVMGSRAHLLAPAVAPDSLWPRFYKLWLAVAEEQQAVYDTLDVAPSVPHADHGPSDSPAGRASTADATGVAGDRSPWSSAEELLRASFKFTDGTRTPPRNSSGSSQERTIAAVLPDPGASRAVFIGTSAFDELEDLPGVPNGIHDLRAVLTDARFGSFAPDRATAVLNPADASQALTPLEQASSDATDTLLVYIACHGLITRYRGELSLALPTSRPQSSFTALPYEWVRELVADSHAQRRIVILDCCFSGRALQNTMSDTDPLSAMATIEGSYVMTSSGATSLALAPSGERYTAFTGALLDTLTRGLPQGPSILDLDTIYRTVAAVLRQRGHPLPQRTSHNSIASLGLVKNAAFRTPSSHET